jgi:hypothetical protein
MDLLLQKWIHCCKNGFAAAKMDLLLPKWIHG